MFSYPSMTVLEWHAFYYNRVKNTYIYIYAYKITIHQIFITFINRNLILISLTAIILDEQI